MTLPEKGITGIYKITNPKGRVYIGQAKCIRKRWLVYFNNHSSLKSQPILFNSLNHHKPENHTFEIIHRCEIDDLNDLERYYQDLYNVTNRKLGLNCVLQKTNERPRVLSQETRDKIGKSKKGIKLSQERIDRMRLSRIGRKLSEETKRKIKETNLGQKRSDEAKLNMSKAQKKIAKYGKDHHFYGKKMSDESRKKISKAKKGKYIGLEHHNSIKIISKNYETKEVLEMGVSETARYFGVDRELIFNRCNSYFVNPVKLKDWDFFYADKINDFKPLNFGQSLVVLDLESGVYYYSIKELAELEKLKVANLARKLRENKHEKYILAND